jgi:very-short-patch-repair endonuclease
MEAPRRTVANAQRLRKEMTPPEVALWDALRRGAQAGLRFRRQHPLGPFVLDFYCARAKLAVEFDSEIHGMGDHPRRDARRDRWVAEQGVATMRVGAVDVRDNLDGVVRTIVEVARERAEPTRRRAPFVPPL